MNPQQLFNQTYIAALNELYQGDQTKVAYTLQVKQATAAAVRAIVPKGRRVTSEILGSQYKGRSLLDKILGTSKPADLAEDIKALKGDRIGPKELTDLHNKGVRGGLARGAGAGTGLTLAANAAMGGSDEEGLISPEVLAALQQYGIGAGEGALGGLAGGALAGDRSLGELGLSGAVGGLGGAGGTALADIEAIQELAAQAGISPAQLSHILSPVLGAGAGAAASGIRQALA